MPRVNNKPKGGKAPDDDPFKAAGADKPSWMAGKGSWSEKDAQFAAAYQEIFGEEINVAALAEARKTNLGLDALKKQWSTDEGSIVDPGDYGAEVVDPESLSGKKKEYYDLWRQANPGREFYDTTSEYLKWEMDATGGNIDGFKAKLAGKLPTVAKYNEDTGDVYNFTYVTPEAVDIMGGKLLYKGNRLGDYVYAPAGLGGGGRTWGKGDADENGYSFYSARGNPSSGLLGDTFVGGVVDKVLPNELLPVLDPFGNSTPILFGREKADERYEVLEDMGIDREKVQTAEAIGRTVLEGALASTGVGMIGVAALEGMNAYANKVNYNQVSAADAFAAAAWNTAAMGASVAGGKLAGALVSAGAQRAQGAEWSDVGENAAWGLAGAQGSVVRLAVDDEYDAERFAFDLARRFAAAAANPNRPSGQSAFGTLASQFYDTSAGDTMGNRITSPLLDNIRGYDPRAMVSSLGDNLNVKSKDAWIRQGSLKETGATMGAPYKAMYSGGKKVLGPALSKAANSKTVEWVNDFWKRSFDSEAIKP